jgi:hypothetical protein
MEFIIERGSHSSQEKGERETKGESCRRWNSEAVESDVLQRRQALPFFIFTVF